MNLEGHTANRVLTTAVLLGQNCTTPDGRYDSQSLYVLRLEQVEKQAIELSSVQFSSVQTEV